MTIDEASKVLASALLMIHVKANTMTPQEADAAVESLAAAISQDLLGKDVDWRDIGILKTTGLTRKMLTQFLVTVATGRTNYGSVPGASDLSYGQIWWERIR
jgi:hypothetical protein